MRGHSSILIIYFCFFRMADHEVISYWKLGHTSRRDQRNQRVIRDSGRGGEKKKEEYQKSCPVHVQQDKTRQQASHGHYWIAFFFKITTYMYITALKLWAHARMNERGT